MIAAAFVVVGTAAVALAINHLPMSTRFKSVLWTFVAIVGGAALWNVLT